MSVHINPKDEDGNPQDEYKDFTGYAVELANRLAIMANTLGERGFDRGESMYLTGVLSRHLMGDMSDD